MLNKITLCGRLGADVELRYTQSGKAVATFNIAVERDGRGTGTDWITIVAWNETAKFAETYFHRGDPILVTGRLQMRSWEDKTGGKRVSAEVVADRLYFVPAAKSESTGTQQYSELQPVDDGDLPF